jgi:hypothetical protein
MNMAPAPCGGPPVSVFSCLYVYIYVFDGDVGSWEAFLRGHGSPNQRAIDGPMVAKLAASLQERPELAQEIRLAVRIIDELAGKLEA